MICTVGGVCVCEWLGGGYVSINIVLMMSLSDYQHLNHTLHIAVKCTEITLVLGTEPSWYTSAWLVTFVKHLYLLQLKRIAFHN